MKRLLNLFLSLALPFLAVAGEVAVTAVTAQQRYPWNGLVDISVTIQGASNDVAVADCLFVATNSVTKAAIPVVHITRMGNDSGSGESWTRRLIWDIAADVGAVKIDDIALTVDVDLPYVQLWENGPYWAKCNVGATKPEEYGYYFWWGDTVGYKRNADGWVSVANGASFSFSRGNCPTYGKSNAQLQPAGYIDSTGNLVAAHDAATAHLGAPWRMPTDAEFSALISNCDTIWTTRNGVSGRLVTGRGAYSLKSIFLPAAGYGYDPGLYDLGLRGFYWSSTPGSDDSYRAWSLLFGSGGFSRGNDYRCYGRSVRPVRGSSGDEPATVFNVMVTGGTGSGAYTSGASVTVTANVPETGYTFIGWMGTGVAYLSNTNNATATLTVPAQDVSLIAIYVKVELVGVQLWENGPYWAECNVGATKPEEYGYYFWWGDTVGYKRNANNDGWVSVADGAPFSFSSGNCPTYGKSNSQLQSEGYIDSAGNLVAAHDAATAHLGAPWRMPTEAEFSALINNCTTTWTTRNGVSGRLVTGRGAYVSRSIFLPAAGYGDGSYLDYPGSFGFFWSSSPFSFLSDNAWYLLFDSGDFFRSFTYCYTGFSVRPVRGFAK